MNFGEAIERVKTRSYIARRTYYTPTGNEIFADDWKTKSDNTLAEWEYL